MILLKLKSKLMGHSCVLQLSLWSCMVALHSFKHSYLILIVVLGSCSSASFARKALLWLGFRLTKLYFFFVLIFPTTMNFAGSWVRLGRALKGEGNIADFWFSWDCWVGFFWVYSSLLIDANALDTAWQQHFSLLLTLTCSIGEFQEVGMHTNHL